MAPNTSQNHFTNEVLKKANHVNTTENKMSFLPHNNFPAFRGLPQNVNSILKCYSMQSVFASLKLYVLFDYEQHFGYRTTKKL